MTFKVRLLEHQIDSDRAVMLQAVSTLERAEKDRLTQEGFQRELNTEVAAALKRLDALRLAASPATSAPELPYHWIGSPMVRENNDPGVPASYVPGIKIGLRDDGAVIWTKKE
jgi:hypothetical protein